ncbi:hypothetical protein [Rhodopirellula bahusiensis]|nr:hypothetical protein [Rhodopirellula bahusiensis]
MNQVVPPPSRAPFEVVFLLNGQRPNSSHDDARSFLPTCLGQFSPQTSFRERVLNAETGQTAATDISTAVNVAGATLAMYAFLFASDSDSVAFK